MTTTKKTKSIVVVFKVVPDDATLPKQTTHGDGHARVVVQRNARPGIHDERPDAKILLGVDPQVAHAAMTTRTVRAGVRVVRVVVTTVTGVSTQFGWKVNQRDAFNRLDDVTKRLDGYRVVSTQRRR